LKTFFPPPLAPMVFASVPMRLDLLNALPRNLHSSDVMDNWMRYSPLNSSFSFFPAMMSFSPHPTWLFLFWFFSLHPTALSTSQQPLAILKPPPFSFKVWRMNPFQPSPPRIVLEDLSFLPHFYMSAKSISQDVFVLDSFFFAGVFCVVLSIPGPDPLVAYIMIGYVSWGFVFFFTCISTL